jgi:hypothetical protein
MQPDLVLNTEEKTVEECVKILLKKIEEK